MTSFGAREREEIRRTIEHDLKNPLSVIVGYAELLRDRSDERTQSEAVSRILDGVDRLRAELDALADRVSGGASLAGDSGNRPRVLLVEDDEDLRRLLHATLAVDDFELLEAGDGQRALELVDEYAPDLLVLDWQLPGRPGREVLAALKRRSVAPRVIILTADPRAAADAGEADVFLTKPFSPVQLYSEIERLLGR